MDNCSFSLFNDETFYQAFIPDIIHARKEIYIESPYLTVKKAELFLPYFKSAINRRIKIIVLTRFPQEHDVILKMQSKNSVSMLKDAGVNVFYFGKLHRKIALIDKKILWEGSLNILSQVYSAEIMRRTENEDEIRKLISFLGLYRFLTF